MGDATSINRLTVQHLLDFYATFAEDDEARQKPDLATIVISLQVIKYFLGDPWIKKNINPYIQKPGFMRITFGQTAADERRKTQIRKTEKLIRALMAFSLFFFLSLSLSIYLPLFFSLYLPLHHFSLSSAHC